MAASMSAPLPPAVTVAVYRALLRTCRNGRHPEIFSPSICKAHIMSSQPADVASLDNERNSIIPSDPKSVITAIRNMMDPRQRRMDNDDDNTLSPIPPPFDALRDATSQATTLIPKLQTLPKKIPIFDYDSAALLPGEQTTFRFFEPRYKRLVKAATTKSDCGGGDGWFLLRASRLLPSQRHSVLARITEHVSMHNGQYAVNATAGPRVSIMVDGTEAVAPGAPELAWAHAYEIEGDEIAADFLDDDNDNNNDSSLEMLYSMRQTCLDLLLDATSIANIASVSMPPFDPEAFSFWVLRFVLGDDDVSARRKWLACRSTSRRLSYVIELLKSFEERRRVKKV